MHYLKLELKSSDVWLAEELTRLSTDKVKMITPIGLLESTDIIVAIIGATSVILKQVAEVIKVYIEQEKNKSFTIKISGEEISFSGYEKEEIEELLRKYGEKNAD